MEQSQIMLKIDAGTDIIEETLDQMTQELLRELTIHEMVGQQAMQPSPNGTKAGIETAMIGGIVLFGAKLSEKLISKMADAIFEWGRNMYKRHKSPVYVAIKTKIGTVEINSNLSKDDVLNALRQFVESPE